MERKAIVKVSFNEESQAQSYYFLKRLIEKILIDRLELSLETKAMLLFASSKVIEGQEKSINKENNKNRNT